MPIYVTIVMPVYDAAKYLAEAIESILYQTHKHFTLLVINDGSNDNTQTILETYTARDSRIQIIQNSHQGFSASLNQGIEAAATEWIFRMDGDDIAHPNRLACQLDFIQQNPQVRITSCMAEYIGSTGKTIGRTVNLVPNEAALKQRLDEGLLIPLLHPGVALHRETVLTVGGYRGQFWPSEDLDLWTRVAETGALVIAMNEALMRYRIHTGSSFVSSPIKILKGEYWIEACAKARRAGIPEPTWEDFCHQREELPTLSKLNQTRLMYARALYRACGMHFICGKQVRAGFDLLSAMLLGPDYTIPRLYKQVFD